MTEKQSAGELTEVLKQHDRIDIDSTAKSKIFAIQEKAQIRWKAGWTNKAGSKKEAEKK